MVNKGWDFAQLMAMPVREFAFWYAEQVALCEAEAAAQRDAAKT